MGREEFYYDRTAVVETTGETGTEPAGRRAEHSPHALYLRGDHPGAQDTGGGAAPPGKRGGKAASQAGHYQGGAAG